MTEEIQKNPDVLECLANLSSDEIFTPPRIVNKMLDLLPESIWSNPEIKFLDPCCKSGVFLREIAKRLMSGLEATFPDEQERRNHIFTKQLYGFAITELTALLSRRSVYCTKTANGEYSICSEFKTTSGNILFPKANHVWKNRKCIFCGGKKDEFGRSDDLETHAYAFIHNISVEEEFKVNFDVIIGNPPYQLNDGGGTGTSSTPIYQKFIDIAMALEPRYISMIIPARWYSGGKGLDEFRTKMLNDKHISKLVDYDNFRDVFPGVDLAGGACYFLWSKGYEGTCKVTNVIGSDFDTMERNLDEYPVFIRSNKSVKFVDKIQSTTQHNLSDRVSIRLPFDIPTTYSPKSSGTPCYFTQKVGLQYVDPNDVHDKTNSLNKWKFIIPKAPIAGQTDFSKPVGFYYDGNTRIAKPGECCSESWLIAGAFDSEEEARNYKSYILTKCVRFLILQTVVSQNMTHKNFMFVPDLGKYDREYTDDYLRELWNITDDEWAIIDSKIRNISGVE